MNTPEEELLKLLHELFVRWKHDERGHFIDFRKQPPDEVAEATQQYTKQVEALLDRHPHVDARPWRKRLLPNLKAAVEKLRSNQPRLVAQALRFVAL